MLILLIILMVFLCIIFAEIGILLYRKLEEKDQKKLKKAIEYSAIAIGIAAFCILLLSSCSINFLL